VPGSLFIYGLYFSISINTITQPVYDAISKFVDFSRIEIYLPFILISYLVGHILSFISSIVVERFSVWKVGYPSKYLLGLGYPNYFDVDKPKGTRIVIRILFALFLLPITVIDVILGNLFHLRELYAKPLDQVLVKLIRSDVEKLVKMKSQKYLEEGDLKFGEVDFFRFVYHYCVEKTSKHFRKMQNYVALYGLLRTMTLVFVLFFWLSIYYYFLSIKFAYLGLLFFGVFSYILFLDFMKFYRRFSLEALMALSSIINHDCSA
jgi:hypothetical protein